jgi:hypothetical protein
MNKMHYQYLEGKIRVHIDCIKKIINEIEYQGYYDMENRKTETACDMIKHHSDYIEKARQDIQKIKEATNNDEIACENKESEDLKEEALRKKAEEFHYRCRHGGKITNDDNMLCSEWASDLSFLRYVDHAAALKEALYNRPANVVKVLVGLPGFMDVLTRNDIEILHCAINNVLLYPKTENTLKIFCIIVATPVCRSALWKMTYQDKLYELTKKEGILRTKNLRDMMWLLTFFMNNCPLYDADEDEFEIQYKDALLKDILSDER